jgi:predicted nucleic acid-binding protein
MNEVFLDASFLLALASPRDALHGRAVMWRYMLPGPFVTTEFVLLEIADGLAARGMISTAVSVMESLRKGPATEIIGAEALWFAKGYALYRQRSDKMWGLTDCISFEIMRERGIDDALTHDHHFEQAGFRALLRQDPPSN